MKSPCKSSYLVANGLEFAFLNQDRHWLKDGLPKGCHPDRGAKRPLPPVQLGTELSRGVQVSRPADIKQDRHWLKDWLKNCSPQDPGVKSHLSPGEFGTEPSRGLQVSWPADFRGILPRRLSPTFCSLTGCTPKNGAGGGVVDEGGVISTHSESEGSVCGQR